MRVAKTLLTAEGAGVKEVECRGRGKLLRFGNWACVNRILLLLQRPALEFRSSAVGLDWRRKPS
jgi:hypothetical protein